MACSSAAVDTIEMESLKHGGEENAPKLFIKHYQATELVPSPKSPLHHLLKKEPAAWACVQISSGVLNLALGVAFAVALGNDFGKLLLTLFRIPIFTGLLFLVAGMLSTLLHRRPGLLQVCQHFNVGCLVATVVGMVLVCVDLGRNQLHMELEKKVEILIVCVMLLDMIICGILILFITLEKRRHEKK